MQDAELARRIALLRGIPLFSSVSEQYLERLVADLRLREFEKDELIFRQGDESRVLLWVVPAAVRGTWRGRDWRLRISQNYQEIELEGEAYGRPLEVRQAKMDGAAIRFSAPGLEFSGRVEGGRIAGELRRGGQAAPLVLVRD